MLLKTRNFEKEGNLSSEKKILAHFFFVYSTIKKVMQQFITVKRSFNKHCACCIFIFLGPMRLTEKKHFEK